MTVAQVRRQAMALPEVTEEPHFQFSSFRVRGRIFVTVSPDEQHVHIFVPEQRREEALAEEPGFLEELRWGAKVVGLRVTLRAAKPAVIARLVTEAWTSKASKRLLAAPAKRAKGRR